MALASSFGIYLSNVFHPATFFVLFSCFLLIHLVLLEAISFAIIAASLTFLLHRLTPLHPPPPHSAVLLTGASSGLGADAAVRLTSLGFKVFATTRRDADGYRLQLRCGDYSDNLIPLTLDVTRPAEVQAAYERVSQTLLAKGWQLFAVILNAGYGEYGPLEMISADRLRHQLEVNVVAQHLLTQTFLPLLRQSSAFDASTSTTPPPPTTSPTPLHPRLLFVSSLASRISLPGRGAYCSSKAALQMLADVYRVELRPFNIQVVAITPGELHSAFHERSRDNWHRVLAETTERSLALPSSAASASATPPPPPLPLSIVNHYDRCYNLSAKRPRTVGDADACTDAIEVALRTRYPLPRYDCGDDGTVSSLITLMPARARDWFLGRWFMQWTTTPAGEDVVERKEEAAAAVEIGGSGGGGGDKRKGDDKLMAAERKRAPEEETEQLTEKFVIEES